MSEFVGMTRQQLVGAAFKRWPNAGMSRISAMGKDALRTALETDSLPDAPTSATADLGQLLAAAIKPYIGDFEDLDAKIEAAVTAAMAKQPRVLIDVKMPDGTTRDCGRQHREFGRLVKMLGLRCNVFMRGPAGSGKTMGAEMAAKALGLRFFPKSMGPETSQYELFGFNAANGTYSPGFLREPFENGGVVLLDEIDASNGAVLTAINSALANGYASFPDAVVAKHPDFMVVAAGNTYGKGADQLYVGRQQLDAATLTRFVFIDWDYDEEAERDWTPGYADSPAVREWVDRVQSLRHRAQERRVRVLITPRASFYGAKMILAGFPLADVEQATIWAPVSTDDRRKVEAA